MKLLAMKQDAIVLAAGPAQPGRRAADPNAAAVRPSWVGEYRAGCRHRHLDSRLLRADDQDSKLKPNNRSVRK